jgi:hypothetical protein
MKEGYAQHNHQLMPEERKKRKKAGVLLTVWWIIWKERNNRIFFSKRRPLLFKWLAAFRKPISLHSLARVSPVE